jgi:hypothetical protein
MRHWLGGTGHRPVAAGDAPGAPRAPGGHHVVREISAPTRCREALCRSGELGSKLPPRTARLAVPPRPNRSIPAEASRALARPRQGPRPVLIPAWASSPGSGPTHRPGLKARAIPVSNSIEKLNRAFSPDVFLVALFLGRWPRLVWLAPLALRRPADGTGGSGEGRRWRSTLPDSSAPRPSSSSA